jgi:hypothetical protein
VFRHLIRLLALIAIAAAGPAAAATNNLSSVASVDHLEIMGYPTVRCGYQGVVTMTSSASTLEKVKLFINISDQGEAAYIAQQEGRSSGITMGCPPGLRHTPDSRKAPGQGLELVRWTIVEA